MSRTRMCKKHQNDAEFKKAVGLRLKEFRRFIKKSRNELADELQIDPGIISEIERGKYLPGFIVEHYLNIQYNMNLRWFTTGRGKMRRLPGKKSKYSKLAQFISQFNENDPLFKKYPELNFLLHIPVIEQIKKEKEYQAKIYKNKERKP